MYDEELTPTDSILLAGEVSPRLREIEITHQITAAPGALMGCALHLACAAAKGLGGNGRKR